MKFIQPVAITDSGAFTRASTATYYNRAGVIAVAAVDEPRFNYGRHYDVVTPLPPTPGLLVEAAKTNLMLQSQDITTWTAITANFAGNASQAPDGTITADRIRPTQTSVSHGASRMASGAVAAGAAVGGSIFLRAAGYDKVIFRCAPSGEAAGFQMAVNLTTGAITNPVAFGTGAVLNAFRVAILPGGWFRLEMEGSVVGATAYGLFVYIGDFTAYAGDGVSGVDAWGAQVELGAVSSYIPTTTAAVTRAADVGVPQLLSNVLEDEPVWSSATAYAIGATVRGATALTKHKLYYSLVASNQNNAVTDATKWLALGATNRWKMFDQALNSQTIYPDSISTVLSVKERVDTIALLNIDAELVNVTITDAGVVVFDETYTLTDDAGINNWHGYFFEDVTRASDKIIQNLPLFTGAQIKITLADPGGTVRCGACILGRAKEIGTANYGGSVGIQDYSVKQRDAFGNYTVLERAFSRRASFEVMVQAGYVDRLHTLLAGYRATPIVYIGADSYASTVVYGFYRDFSVAISYPSHSLCTLELEGLT